MFHEKSKKLQINQLELQAVKAGLDVAIHMFENDSYIWLEIDSQIRFRWIIKIFKTYWEIMS